MHVFIQKKIFNFQNGQSYIFFQTFVGKTVLPACRSRAFRQYGFCGEYTSSTQRSTHELHLFGSLKYSRFFMAKICPKKRLLEMGNEDLSDVFFKFCCMFLQFFLQLFLMVFYFFRNILGICYTKSYKVLIQDF